jgi:ferritin-like metal-binding protein YciE
MKSTNSKSNGKGKKSNSNGKDSQNAEDSFKKLFEEGLKDIYWVEKTLTKAIPKMIKNATSDELIAALEEHLTVTQEQVTKVEQVFEAIGKKPQAKACVAMQGIIDEGEETMEEHEGIVRDAGIICSAQKVEHYEIASYGSLASFAKTLGLEEAAALLEEILNEEKEADTKLTEVAESSVNMEAVMQGDEEEQESTK